MGCGDERDGYRWNGLTLLYHHGRYSTGVSTGAVHMVQGSGNRLADRYR